jgi:hypothetical protein
MLDGFVSRMGAVASCFCELKASWMAFGSLLSRNGCQPRRFSITLLKKSPFATPKVKERQRGGKAVVLRDKACLRQPEDVGNEIAVAERNALGQASFCLACTSQEAERSK